MKTCNPAPRPAISCAQLVNLLQVAAQSSSTYSSAKNKVLWETYRLNKLKKCNAQKFSCEIIIIFKAFVNICAIIGHNWNKFTKQVSICLPHSADNEIRRISFVRKPFFISYQIKTDLRENIFPFRHSTISPLPLVQINYARRAQLEPPSTQPIAKGIGREWERERGSCVWSYLIAFHSGPVQNGKALFTLSCL